MIATSSTVLDAFVDHLERLDAAAVVGLVEQMVERGSSLGEVVTTVLLPAWERIDARSAAGELDAATSGAAAAVSRRALAGAARRAHRPVPSTGGPLAVVSPSGSAALFGAEAVGELAAAAGWIVDCLSGASAADELLAYARVRHPLAVVVTAHCPTDLPALAAAVHAAHREGVAVLAWGPAFGAGDRRARRLGADAWAASLDEAIGVLGVWRQRRPAAGPVVGLPVAYVDLERLRPALLAAAAGVAGDDGEPAEWARRAGPALVMHLSAAVAVGDPSILAEHLDRERRVLGRSQMHDLLLVGLVDAIAAALPLTADVAREYVFTSREELRRSLMGASRVTRIDRGVAGTTRPATVAPANGATPAPDGAAAEGAANGIGAAGAGQVFADLLLLAALACQTPLALLSVPQSPGQWRTLSHGFDTRTGLNDPRLFDLVVAQVAPVEITDLANHPELARIPLAAPPHNLRWVYAAALRSDNGTVLGVIAVMDRWLRELTRREQRAMQAVVRQGAIHLGQLRKAAPAPTAWSPAPAAPPARPDPLAALVGLRRPAALAEGQQLLRSHEVAVLFDVTERTVINWAAAGKLPSLRTIGGHLRFRREDVLDLLAGRTSKAR
jgi:excisionase family DNA binding protein